MHHTKRSLSLHAIAAAVLFASLSTLLTGCGSGVNPDMAAYIKAAQNTLRAGDTAQINRVPANIAGTELVYSVNGVKGGNAKYGTVDRNGVYTAPTIVPSPNNVTITTVATNFPNGKPGSVAFTVLNPIPVISAVSPSTFPEGTATITVTGSRFVYGAQIFWNGAAIPTTYVSATQLAASIAAPLPGNNSLYVRNPDPGAANSAAVPITVTPGQVMLKVLTNAGSSVRVNNSLRIDLTVSGTQNTGVTWQVNGIPGGNPQIGTVVANRDGSATYTAPPVVPTPNNIVTLTAISVDNPAVTINQNITVMNPIPILLSAMPMNFNVGSATVVVTGDRFINGAQVLMNGVPAPTTFNGATQLTATLNLTDPGNLDLQVLNPAPGRATSANLIARVTGNPPVPLVTPEDASRFLAQSTFGATDGDIKHLSKIGYTYWFAE